MCSNLKIKKVIMFLTVITFISIMPFQTIIFAKENTDNNDNTQIISLYCWDIGDVNLSKLKDEVEYLKINTLYIQNSTDTLKNDRLKQIMEFAKQYNIDVFLLEGAQDWLTTGDMKNVTDLIDTAYEMNKTLDYKFKGVSLDVEFYLTDEYAGATYERQLELFRIFTENTKKCCDYANNLGLGYSMALPVWLDKLAGDELENLINYHYDHIAFMNYYKETIMENLDQEVEIARKNNIKIVSIAEVQDPRNGNVGEEDTFYNDGLQKCINTLNEIKQKYNYENLGTSYHYYKPLLELLERDTEVGIENKYEIEVYPYKGENSVKVDEATIASSDGTILHPISGYYSEAKEHIVNFYELEYGKQYTLTVKSGNSVGTKTFTYQKDSEDLSNLEIIYMSIALEEPEESNPSEQTPEITEPEITEPEESNPSEETPEITEPEESNPSEQTPEITEPEITEPEESNPSEQTPETTNPSKQTLETTKTETTRPDTTVAKSNLPQTGERNFIEKLLPIAIAISAIVMFSLATINNINQMDLNNKK